MKYPFSLWIKIYIKQPTCESFSLITRKFPFQIWCFFHTKLVNRGRYSFLYLDGTEFNNNNCAWHKMYTGLTRNHRIWYFEISTEEFLIWFIFNPFASGILYIFPVPHAGFFSVKIRKKFLAIKNFSVNETMSGQPNKCLIHWHFEN